ncbi:MAG: hypothetical protein ACI30W_01795 [Muribaculaceae bacterium]
MRALRTHRPRVAANFWLPWFCLSGNISLMADMRGGPRIAIARTYGRNIFYAPASELAENC